MLISVLVIGLLIGTGIHILSALLVSFRSWRGGRRQKKAEEVSSIYRSGVGRLLSRRPEKGPDPVDQGRLRRDSRRVDTHLALASVALQEGKPEEGGRSAAESPQARSQRG